MGLRDRTSAREGDATPSNRPHCLGVSRRWRVSETIQQRFPLGAAAQVLEIGRKIPMQDIHKFRNGHLAAVYDLFQYWVQWHVNATDSWSLHEKASDLYVTTDPNKKGGAFEVVDRSKQNTVQTHIKQYTYMYIYTSTSVVDKRSSPECDCG